MHQSEHKQASTALAAALEPPKYPLLECVTSPTVATAQAAFYLNRRPQTIRTWACFENGPIRPLRINGRLAWRVADIKALVAGGA